MLSYHRHLNPTDMTLKLKQFKQKDLEIVSKHQVVLLKYPNYAILGVS